jgi:hypothetical protein
MTYKQHSSITWRDFLDGFLNILYIIDSYDTIEHFPNDFWESLNWGYIQMEDEFIMSQPGFDPYNLRGRDSYYSYVMRKK